MEEAKIEAERSQGNYNIKQNFIDSDNKKIKLPLATSIACITSDISEIISRIKLRNDSAVAFYVIVERLFYGQIFLKQQLCLRDCEYCFVHEFCPHKSLQGLCLYLCCAYCETEAKWLGNVTCIRQAVLN